MRVLLRLLLPLAVTAVACSPPDDEQAAEASEVDCLTVPPSKVDQIESGLTVQGGGNLRSAEAVRSGAHRSVYFVSADLEGPGLEGPGHLATWAVTELNDTGGLVLAVSGQAKEFSDWPAGEQTDARTTMSDPGARESQSCVSG